MKESKIRLAISVGDLNGIGPEVILKTFEDARMFDFCTPVLFANAKLMSFLKKGLNTKIYIEQINSLDAIVDGKFNVIDVWKESVQINFGKEDPKIGAYAINSSFKAFVAASKDLIA